MDVSSDKKSIKIMYLAIGNGPLSFHSLPHLSDLVAYHRYAKCPVKINRDSMARVWKFDGQKYGGLSENDGQPIWDFFTRKNMRSRPFHGEYGNMG